MTTSIRGTARIHVKHTGEVTCAIGRWSDSQNVPVEHVLVAQQDCDAVFLSFEEARVCIDGLIECAQESDWKTQGDDLRRAIFELPEEVYVKSVWAAVLKDDQVASALKRALAFVVKRQRAEADESAEFERLMAACGERAEARSQEKTLEILEIEAADARRRTEDQKS